MNKVHSWQHIMMNDENNIPFKLKSATREHFVQDFTSLVIIHPLHFLQSLWNYRICKDIYTRIIIYTVTKYDNVCLFVRSFLNHFETHWGALWHKVAFWSRKGSKTTIFGKTQTMWKRCMKYIIFCRFGQISQPFGNCFGCSLA